MRLKSWYAHLSPARQTLLDVALLYLGYLLVLPLALRNSQLGMSSENGAGISQLFQLIQGGGPVRVAFSLLLGVLLVTVVAPVIEELIFRGLPLLVGGWLKRWFSPQVHSAFMWTLGVVMAVVFARAHNLVTPGALPLPQLLLGLMAWRAAYTRGLRYSMLLHGLNNLVVALLLALVFYGVRTGSVDPASMGL